MKDKLQQKHHMIVIDWLINITRNPKNRGKYITWYSQIIQCEETIYFVYYRKIVKSLTKLEQNFKQTSKK